MKDGSFGSGRISLIPVPFHQANLFRRPDRGACSRPKSLAFERKKAILWRSENLSSRV